MLFICRRGRENLRNLEKKTLDIREDSKAANKGC